MDINEYAPAPWRIGDEYGPVMDEIVAANGRTIAAVWTHGNRSPMRAAAHRMDAKVNPGGMAVAHLMEAAPELLAALENCVMELRQYHAHYNAKCEGGCPALVYIEEAESAIAKAKGS